MCEKVSTDVVPIGLSEERKHQVSRLNNRDPPTVHCKPQAEREAE